MPAVRVPSVVHPKILILECMHAQTALMCLPSVVEDLLKYYMVPLQPLFENKLVDLEKRGEEEKAVKEICHSCLISNQDIAGV